MEHKEHTPAHSTGDSDNCKRRRFIIMDAWKKVSDRASEERRRQAIGDMRYSERPKFGYYSLSPSGHRDE